MSTANTHLCALRAVCYVVLAGTPPHRLHHPVRRAISRPTPNWWRSGYGCSLRALVQWTMLRRYREAGGRWQSRRKQARQVERFVAPEIAPKLPEGKPKLPSAQSVAWLLLKDETALPEAKQLLECLKQDGEFITASR